VAIDLIAPKPPRQERPVHPEWAAWIEASAYTHAVARSELGLANGTFYRRIAREPTLIDRLAMRALYEGLEPYGAGESE
jgi:hypothetical protein